MITQVDERRATASIYRLASRLFATEVDLTLYRALVSAAESPDSERAGLILLDETFRDLDETTAVELLAVEYCRLFIGPRPACPPYAGHHLGQGVVTGRAALAVTRIAARGSLRIHLPVGAPVEANDHVAVVLSLLAELELRAVATGRTQLLDELLHQHVLTWVPDYLRRVASEARIEPYRSLARVVRTVLLGPTPADGTGHGLY